MNEYLTAHFSLRELTKSATAAKHGIDNSPDDVEISNLKYLCQAVLEPLRMWFNSPVNISSAFRCKKLNDVVGSNDKSFHVRGCAADIDRVKGVELIEVVRFIYTYLPFTELIAEYLPDGWVHVAIKKGRENEKTLKIKDKNYNYVICDSFEVLEELING